MGGLGCDNMTVVLVLLLQENTWAQYVELCGRPRPPSPEPDGDSLDSHTFVTPPHTPRELAHCSMQQLLLKVVGDDEEPPATFSTSDEAQPPASEETAASPQSTQTNAETTAQEARAPAADVIEPLEADEPSVRQ